MPMNNSTNIQKNSKSFLGMSIMTKRNCSIKKNGDEKSRDTVTLMKGQLSTEKAQRFKSFFIGHEN
jgi:hypothetical protein